MLKSKILFVLIILTIGFMSCAKDDDTADDIISTANLPLKGSQSVPSNQSTSTGTLSATFNKSTGVLEYTLQWIGLSGPHQGIRFQKAPRGQNGPVVKNISVTGEPNGTIVETWTVPDSLHAKLQSGGMYININTDTYPDGELRGQLEF